MKRVAGLQVGLPWWAHVIGLLFLAAAALEPFPVLGHDPSSYVGTAMSMADSLSYSFNGRPQTQYPPGFPVFLAVVGGGISWSPVVLQIATTTIGLLGLVLLFGHLREDVPRLAGIVLFGTLFSALFFREMTMSLRSEPLFFFLSVAAIRLLERRPEGRRADRTGLLELAGIALVVGLVVATRTIGIALVAACMSCAAFGLLFGTRGPGFRRLTAGVVGGAVATAAWLGWVAGSARPLPGEHMHSYLAQIRLLDPRSPDAGEAALVDLLLRLPDGVLELQAQVAAALMNLKWITPFLGSPPVLLGAIFLLLGAWVRLRSERPFIVHFVAAYGGVLVLWPFEENGRFIMPVVPLVALLVTEGVVFAAHWARSRRGTARKTALIVAACGLSLTALQLLPGGHGWTFQVKAALLGWAATIALLIAHRGRTRVRWTDPRPWLILGAAYFALVGVSRNTTMLLDRQEAIESGARQSYGAEAVAWLEANAHPDEVVMAEAMAEIALNTGLRTVPFPVTGHPERLSTFVAASGADWLIVRNREPFPYFLPEEEDRLELLREVGGWHPAPVYQYGGGWIYRLEKAAGVVITQGGRD